MADKIKLGITNIKSISHLHEIFGFSKPNGIAAWGILYGNYFLSFAKDISAKNAGSF